jgi:hypothetical protein
LGSEDFLTDFFEPTYLSDEPTAFLMKLRSLPNGLEPHTLSYLPQMPETALTAAPLIDKPVPE